MSARATTCVVIVCDGCRREHEWEDCRPYHWASRKEAADSEREDGGDWEIPTGAEGPDLCPACVCARDGHRWGDPIRGNVRAIQVCRRCGVTRDPAAKESDSG